MKGNSERDSFSIHCVIDLSNVYSANITPKYNNQKLNVDAISLADWFMSDHLKWQSQLLCI